MQSKILKQKSLKELTALLFKKRAKLTELRFRITQADLRKVHQVKIVRKEIAQILTIITSLSKKNNF